jgi:hypothetical protein
MRSLFKIVAILAVVNLLAVAGLVGWLVSQGRVDRERVAELTAILGETPEERAARIEAVRLEEEAAKAPKPADDGDIRATDDLNRSRIETTMIDRERLERLQREVRDLQNQLRQQRLMLERERSQFEQDKAAFQAMRDRLYEIDGAEYFRKSLEVLTGMKPADVRPVFLTMIGEGKTEEVISYLSAFDERHRAKVMTEFVKGGDVDLAAGLLESLRTRGLEPVAAGVNENDR